MKVSYVKKGISFIIALVMTASLFSISLEALGSTEVVHANLWHGAPMLYVNTNSDGTDIYSIKLDYKEYDSVVFNDFNSSNQTVDIQIGDSGTCYYLSGNKIGNKCLVSSYMY